MGMYVTIWINKEETKTEIRDYDPRPDPKDEPFSCLEISRGRNQITLHFDNLKHMEKFLADLVLEINAMLGAKGELNRIPVKP